jgi:hypothetical protein
LSSVLVLVLSFFIRSFESSEAKFDSNLDMGPLKSQS